MELRVKEITKEKGITMGDLAEKMGVVRESLSRAINGNPTLETLNKIAIALEVSISELFDDKTQVGDITLIHGDQMKRFKSLEELKRYVEAI